MLALSFSTLLAKGLIKKTGKVSTRVNVWQYTRWMSILLLFECINYLVQFITGR